MTSKRICAICVLVLLLGSCIGAVLPVQAESNWTAALKVEAIHENTQEKTITVRVSVEQIACQSGIFLAEYDIHYDNSVLKLISWENSKPTGWTFSGSKADAEDWTKTKQTTDNKKETYLSYTLLSYATANGVKRNDQLYTDLHFKVLSDPAGSTEITITNILFADVAMDKCRLPDQKYTIGLHGNTDSSGAPAESSNSSVAGPSDEPSDEPSTSQSPDGSDEPSSPASESTTGGDEPTEDPDSSSESLTDPSADPTSAPSAGDISDPSVGSSTEPATDTSTDPASGPSSEGDPNVSDGGKEENSKKVRMWITVEDIKDPSGVSGLSFTLKYNADFLKYVSHECLLPADWNLQSEYTEDLTEVSKGNIVFHIVNSEEGHSVKENGTLGVLVEFTFAGTDFDPSLLTIENERLFNGEINEMSIDDYRLATRYEFDGEVISDDTFSSNENEGSALKIWIAVIAAVVVLAGAVVTFLVIRKKKLA